MHLTNTVSWVEHHPNQSIYFLSTLRLRGWGDISKLSPDKKQAAPWPGCQCPRYHSANNTSTKYHQIFCYYESSYHCVFNLSNNSWKEQLTDFVMGLLMCKDSKSSLKRVLSHDKDVMVFLLPWGQAGAATAACCRHLWWRVVIVLICVTCLERKEVEESRAVGH